MHLYTNYYSLDDVSSDSDDDLKLKKPSPSNVSHEWGGPPAEETVAVVHIMNCPTITVHARKWYKALIDSGAAISLLRYSAYKNIEDCYKTPIQPTTAKLNTSDGSPMSALGMAALHLRIAKFKFTHNFIICDQLPDMELIFSIDIPKNKSISYAWDKERNCYIQKEGKFLTYTRNCKQKTAISTVKLTLKYHQDTMVLY